MQTGTSRAIARSETIMFMTPTARVAAFSLATLILLVPALWNGFPLLFYDTGAYLGRYFFDTLSPGRSAVYGLFLGTTRRPDFWPTVIAQSLVTVWLVALFLRAQGFGNRPYLLVGLIALLSVATSLPWLTGQLMPDVFAGLAVIAVYLLVFRSPALFQWEQIALVLFVAFAAASHNATLAVLILLVAAGLSVRLLWPHLVPVAGLLRSTAAIVLGVAMLLTANFAVTGKLAWTPGGTAFFFGRLVHDGIVHRYLDDNCPNPDLVLCQHRGNMPDHINTFLWHGGADGPFPSMGGFQGGDEEMREIIAGSFLQYPGMHLTAAIGTTFTQLFAVGTGYGIEHDVWDAYGHIENLTPEAVPAAHSARQRHQELNFDGINLLHRPVAWLSMGCLAIFLLLAWRYRQFASLGPMAATFAAALLANAAVCGIFSYAHDRYGARILWIAALFVAIAVARAVPALALRPASPGPLATVGTRASLIPQPSYLRQKAKQD
jgi:hypothetical protein